MPPGANANWGWPWPVSTTGCGACWNRAGKRPQQAFSGSGRAAAPAATKELARGLELLLAHLRELLTGLGMESIATVDHPFDPLTMQAISTVADPERADGLVTEKLKSGWLYRGDLLQPAEVIVNRRPAPAEAAGETATETG